MRLVIDIKLGLEGRSSRRCALPSCKSTAISGIRVVRKNYFNLASLQLLTRSDK